MQIIKSGLTLYVMEEPHNTNQPWPGVEPLNSSSSPIPPAAVLKILKIIGRKSEIRFKLLKSANIELNDQTIAFNISDLHN